MRRLGRLAPIKWRSSGGLMIATPCGRVIEKYDSTDAEWTINHIRAEGTLAYEGLATMNRVTHHVRQYDHPP